MRLIDADAFKKYIIKGFEEMKSQFKTEFYLDIAARVTESFLEDIDEQPTVEAQPTDADCISRSELLRHQHIIYDDDGEGYRAVYVKDIKAMPSVTPERPKGKWVNKQFINSIDGDIRDGWECSKCQSRFFRYDIPNTEDFIPKYCPNCGAEMNGGGEDEEEHDS